MPLASACARRTSAVGWWSPARPRATSMRGKQLIVPVQQEPGRVPQQLVGHQRPLVSMIHHGHAVPTENCNGGLDQGRVAMPVQARRHARAGPYQGEGRHVQGLEVGGHLLAQGPIEQPGGGLAERPAEQRAELLRRGQLPPAVMDEEWHAATALVGLSWVRQNVRPGTGLRAGAGEIVDAGHGAAAGPKQPELERRRGRVQPHGRLPETDVNRVEKESPGQRRGAPATPIIRPN